MAHMKKIMEIKGAEMSISGKLDNAKEAPFFDDDVVDGWSKWLEVHDKKVRADAINNFVVNAITEFQKFELEHGYPTLGDISVVLSDVAEQLKEKE